MSTSHADPPVPAMYRRTPDELRAWWDRRDPEPALEPELPIIDAHHHLWDRARERYLLEEFLEDANSGHRIVSSVYVEAGSMYRASGPAEEAPLGEIEFATGVAAMSASGRYGECRVAEGVVGRVDLTVGRAAGVLLDRALHISSGRLKSIRHGLAWDPSPGISAVRQAGSSGTSSRFATERLSESPAFREGFAELAARGLAFDLFMFHPQLGEAVELARSFPETTIVVNHAGGPLGVGRYATGISESRSVWRDALVRLAAEPNVVMKIGGLGMPLFGFGMEEREVPPTSEQLAAAWSATVDTCIEAFGSNRCMFESNLPPDGQSGRYVTIWNAYKRITSLASASEKADLYHGTAARTYDLVRPTTPQHA